MEHLRWLRRPELERPIVLTAFEGWNDAGEAASGALRWLAEQWGARPFAEIDPEDFYDFTCARPEITREAGHRRISWPGCELSEARVPETGADVVFVVGTEPALRWRTFCRQITGLATHLDASMAVTVGALLAEVSHARPVPVVGTSTQGDLADRLDLEPPTYEGPTGIVGVLHAALAEIGVPTASLWAAVPGYVPAAPSPKAQLALVERCAGLIDHRPATIDLQFSAVAYERQLDDLVATDEDLAAYLERIDDEDEDGEDEEAGPGDATFQDDGDETGDLTEAGRREDTERLMAEVERFLWDQRDGP